MVDICIIGGGASGMTAAISAAEENQQLDILILEKKNQLGKKILASGNGKCNLSNVRCENYKDTLDFFASVGVMTRTDSEGRIYPYTEEARAVRDALEQRLRSLDVKVETSAEVASVEYDGVFHIELKNKTVEARKVLVACGGKAGADFGSTGDGFRFAKRLGHQVHKPVPVLTAVELADDVSRLAGIRVKGEVSLYFREEQIFSEKGEIQFTSTGISGICVFNLSRFLLIPEGKGLEDGFSDYRIDIDFFPEEEDLLPILEQRKACGFEGSRLLQFLVRRPIGEIVFERCNGDPAGCAKMLKAFSLLPKGVKGWDFAQATKGGVSFAELDEKTLASKLVPGLYFAGEVLDYDGPCGGYNLQHAWETGRRSGKEMAK
ncbi:MAG: NAD(P)/FAD-dependent oxidoreductase [Emergencia sp.]